MAIMFLILEVLAVLGLIASISVVLPAFLIAAVAITAVYTCIGWVYLASSRELKRLDSTTRSPILNTLAETLHGVVTIRSFGDSPRFISLLCHLLDTNQRPFFALWQANRCEHLYTPHGTGLLIRPHTGLSVRIDIAGSLVAVSAAAIVLLSPTMDAALAGFVLTFAVAFSDRMLWVVRMWSQVEVNANSIERVLECERAPAPIAFTGLTTAHGRYTPRTGERRRKHPACNLAIARG